MKKTALILIGMVISFTMLAQDPPSAVTDAFAKMFPKSTDVEWEQESKTEWEAEFTFEEKEISAAFDEKGNWLETESDICLKKIPAEVYKVVFVEFNGWTLAEAEQVETPNFKGYELDLKKNDTKVEVMVSEKGEMSIEEVKVGKEACCEK